MKERLLVLAALLLPFVTFAQESSEMGLDERINAWFEPITAVWEGIVFWQVPGTGIPLVVIILVLGATFFTLYFGFVNIRRFPLAINVVRGKYDAVEEPEGHGVEKAEVNIVDGDLPDTIRDESKQGEVSHFQALATAVSGTVGLGNIAGVALAIAIGGPGATFWMIICGLLSMSTKFVECTLGVKYRDVDENGTV